MAIIPKRENFQVMPTSGVSATVGGAPTKIDASSGYDNLSNALMRTAHVLDRKEDEDARAEAMYAASQYQEALDTLRYDKDKGFVTRKGLAANKNADGTGVFEEYQRSLKAAREASANGLSSRSLQYFNQYVQPKTEAFGRALKAHQLSEDRDWKISVNNGRAEQHLRDFSINILDDQDAATASFNGLRENALELQKLHGWSAEETQNWIASRVSTGIVSQVGMLMDEGELEKSKKLFESGKAFLTANDAIRTKRILDRGERDAEAVAAGNKIFTAFEKPQTEWQARLHATGLAESNNKDYDKNGMPVTSAKGALYRMQVMPDTAKNPGFGIAPAKDNSAAEYNRVGEQLLEKLAIYYGGDMDKAHAAYNTGSGRINDLVKKYGNQWLSHAPQETQGYVAKINEKMRQWRTQKSSAAATNEEYEKAAKMLNLTPRQMDLAAQTAKKLAKESHAARKREEEDASKTVYQVLINSGGDMSAVPAELLDYTNPEERVKFMNFAKALSNGVTRDDPEVYLKSLDGEYLAGLSESEFLSMQSQLTKPHWEAAAKLRMDTMKGGKAAYLSRADRDFVNNRLQQIGINTSPKKTDTEAVSKLATIHSYLRKALKMEEELNGRPFSIKEKEAFFDREFARSFTFTQSFLGLPAGTANKRTITLEHSDIPSESLAVIRADAEKKGVKLSKSEELEVYMMMRRLNNG